MLELCQVSNNLATPSKPQLIISFSLLVVRHFSIVLRITPIYTWHLLPFYHSFRSCQSYQPSHRINAYDHDVNSLTTEVEIEREPKLHIPGPAFLPRSFTNHDITNRSSYVNPTSLNMTNTRPYPCNGTLHDTFYSPPSPSSLFDLSWPLGKSCFVIKDRKVLGFAFMSRTLMADRSYPDEGGIWPIGAVCR